MNGCRIGISSARILGAFTANWAGWPASTASTSWATWTATFACASTVEAPRCGVAMTRGWRGSGIVRATGSLGNTSMAGPAKVPGVQRRQQRRLVDQLAARAVHQEGARLHPRQPFGVHDAARGLGQRHVQRDVVGLLQQRRADGSPPRVRTCSSGTYGS